MMTRIYSAHEACQILFWIHYQEDTQETWCSPGRCLMIKFNFCDDSIMMASGNPVYSEANAKNCFLLSLLISTHSLMYFYTYQTVFVFGIMIGHVIAVIVNENFGHTTKMKEYNNTHQCILLCTGSWSFDGERESARCTAWGNLKQRSGKIETAFLYRAV